MKFKDADMCITLTPPTIAQKSVIDSSYLVIEEDMSIIIPYPNQGDKFDILLKPFQKDVILQSNIFYVPFHF